MVCQRGLRVRVLRCHYQHTRVGRSTNMPLSRGALWGSPAWHGPGLHKHAAAVQGHEGGWWTDPAGSAAACALGFASQARSAGVGVCVSSQQSPLLQGCCSSFHAVCLRLFLLQVPGCECPHRARRRVRTSVGSEPGQLVCCSAGGAGVGTRRVEG